MKHLKSGQHFGVGRKKLALEDTILTEAGYCEKLHVPWHYHENAYFFYHLRGHLEEVNKKGAINCNPGTLLFHHWQDPHYDHRFTRDAAFFHIEIEDKWFRRHQLKPSMLEGSFQLVDPALKPLFARMHAELSHCDAATQISVDGLLLQSVAHISRMAVRDPSRVPPWVSQVKQILHDGTTENLRLGFLSAETGIHPVHLSKQFPKYFGSGFGEYIRGLRIEKAIGLLAEKSRSLSEIAHECGFADQSHFNRSFRRSMGITPSQYRRLK